MYFDSIVISGNFEDKKVIQNLSDVFMSWLRKVTINLQSDTLSCTHNIDYCIHNTGSLQIMNEFCC